MEVIEVANHAIETIKLLPWPSQVSYSKEPVGSVIEVGRECLYRHTASDIHAPTGKLRRMLRRVQGFSMGVVEHYKNNHLDLILNEDPKIRITDVIKRMERMSKCMPSGGFAYITKKETGKPRRYVKFKYICGVRQYCPFCHARQVEQIVAGLRKLDGQVYCVNYRFLGTPQIMHEVTSKLRRRIKQTIKPDWHVLMVRPWIEGILAEDRFCFEVVYISDNRHTKRLMTDEMEQLSTSGYMLTNSHSCTAFCEELVPETLHYQAELIDPYFRNTIIPHIGEILGSTYRMNLFSCDGLD